MSTAPAAEADKIGGAGGRRRWADVGGDRGLSWAASFNGAGGVARGGRRRRSPSRWAVQVGSRDAGPSGRRRYCWPRAGTRRWCWSRRRSRRAAAPWWMGSRRWLQGAGDGGGGRKEMELFVACLKLCFFLKKSKYTAPWTTFLGLREYYF